MITNNSGRKVITRADLKAWAEKKEQNQINHKIISPKIDTIEILEKYQEERPIHQFCVEGNEGKIRSVGSIEKKRIQELETIGLIYTKMNVKARTITAKTTPFGRSFISKSESVNKS